MQVNLAATTKQETGGEGRASVSIKVLGAGPTWRANTHRGTCRGLFYGRDHTLYWAKRWARS